MTSRIPQTADPYEEAGQSTGGDDTLDAKRITGDTQDGIPAPGDVSTAVEDWGTTASEEREGEPMDLKLSREEPDQLAAADEPVDELLATGDPYPADEDERAGRLVAPDQGARGDTEPDESAYDVGTDEGGFSAEERAIHIEPEA